MFAAASDLQGERGRGLQFFGGPLSRPPLTRRCAPPSPARGEGVPRSALKSSFSPCGRRCPKGADEGAGAKRPPKLQLIHRMLMHPRLAPEPRNERLRIRAVGTEQAVLFPVLVPAGLDLAGLECRRKLGTHGSALCQRPFARAPFERRSARARLWEVACGARRARIDGSTYGSQGRFRSRGR